MTSLPGTMPNWNNAGVLPPIRPTAPGDSIDRSPYTLNLVTLVNHFNSMLSLDRIAILNGFMKFRASLHQAGIVNGFQWLDGSFLEHVEILESRPPRDMDVVTFFHLPDGHDQQSLAQRNPLLFDHKRLKTSYMMDAYFFVLGNPTEAYQVQKISYWYSMWSHRRDGLWKGFIQIDLDPSQDIKASAILNPAGGMHHE
ncbi:MAG: hypothetical protein H7839_17845 [Magnetococcus sp. YQC-5]